MKMYHLARLHWPLVGALVAWLSLIGYSELNAYLLDGISGASAPPCGNESRRNAVDNRILNEK